MNKLKVWHILLIIIALAVLVSVVAGALGYERVGLMIFLALFSILGICVIVGVIRDAICGADNGDLKRIGIAGVFSILFAALTGVFLNPVLMGRSGGGKTPRKYVSTKDEGKDGEDWWDVV